MLIQMLKQQKQHFKPLLKIAEKPDTVFAMALFFMSNTVLEVPDSITSDR
jgi:hypothetical protein